MRKFLVIVILLCLYQTSGFAQLTGKVVAISDGDTFTLLTENKQQIKIRLYGIDCPEKNQDYGARAKEFTSNLIFGKTVVAQEKDIDKYGRTIAIVTIDTLNLNEMLLQAGYAWHYQYFDSNQGWQQLQLKAQMNKIGLWASQSEPIAPWEFRRSN